jgi:hypothetical protein
LVRLCRPLVESCGISGHTHHLGDCYGIKASIDCRMNAAVASLVCASGVLAFGSAAIYVLLAWALLGATAAVIIPGYGATILPSVLFIPFLVGHALLKKGSGGLLRQVEFPNAGFWLLYFVIWGGLTAYYMPRLFGDRILVHSINRGMDVLASEAVSVQLHLSALQPVSGNITQVGYAVGGLCTFVAVRALLDDNHGMRHFRDAALLLAGLNVLAALLDLGEFYAGIPGVLDYVRTARYTLHVDEILAGVHRVSGTFSESSVFAAFTLPLFAFTLVVWRSGNRRLLSGLLALASLMLLLMSTSATAYVGLAIYLAILCGSVVWRSLDTDLTRSFCLVLATLILTATVLFSILMFVPDALGQLSGFLDRTVLDKLESASGMLRASVNRQAWSNVVDTYGTGVGLGSAQASSFVLVLLSNTGLVGTLLFAAFLFPMCNRGRRPLRDRNDAPTPEEVTRRAARHAVLASLIAATLSGLVFNLGMAFYAFAAAAVPPARRAGIPGTNRERAY